MQINCPPLAGMIALESTVWCVIYISLRKTVGKASLILVTLTSRSDSDFKRSNVSLKENKPNGVNSNSNDIDYYVRKNEGKILWFSADWYDYSSRSILFRAYAYFLYHSIIYLLKSINLQLSADGEIPYDKLCCQTHSKTNGWVFRILAETDPLLESLL